MSIEEDFEVIICVGIEWFDYLFFVYIGLMFLFEEEECCYCDCVLYLWLEGRFYCCVGIER